MYFDPPRFIGCAGSVLLLANLPGDNYHIWHCSSEQSLRRLLLEKGWLNITGYGEFSLPDIGPPNEELSGEIARFIHAGTYLSLTNPPRSNSFEIRSGLRSITRVPVVGEPYCVYIYIAGEECVFSVCYAVDQVRALHTKLLAHQSLDEMLNDAQHLPEQSSRREFVITGAAANHCMTVLMLVNKLPL